jgi:hypothetical protein
MYEACGQYHNVYLYRFADDILDLLSELQFVEAKSQRGSSRPNLRQDCKFVIEQVVLHRLSTVCDFSERSRNKDHATNDNAQNVDCANNQAASFSM